MNIPPTFLNSDTVVLMRGITKEFYGFKALDNVDFDIKKGEIHVLLGENGAGKTTLVKILTGVYLMDRGEIYIDGVKRDIRNVGDAVKYGISIVNQYPQLIDELTITENISLSLRSLGIIHRFNKIKEKIIEYSDKYSFKLDPDKYVRDLSFSERQRVEILKAILLDSKVIIMDEPTTLLTTWERKLIYQFMKRAKEEGRSLVLITHKLSEALEVADRITILKKGRVVARLNAEDATYGKLMKLMFDKMHAKTVDRKRDVNSRNEVLRIEDLMVLDEYGRKAVKNVNLKLYSGEIVGIAGIAGNGQRELIEAIYGVRRREAGKIIFLGRDISKYNARELRKLIGYIPDKIPEAVILNMPIYENLILKKYDNSVILRKKIFIDYKSVYKYSDSLISEYNIAAEDPGVEAGTLSGGNLQKLVLARELSLDPPLIIAVNPSKTLDHFSTELLHSTLIKYRDHGKAILLVSEDSEEVMKVSDRIMVMHEGNLYELGSRDEVDLGLIEEYMIRGGEAEEVIKVG